MPLLGTAAAFWAFVLAELGGNSSTRGATRTAFAIFLLLEAGVSISGFASWAGDAFQMLPL